MVCVALAAFAATAEAVPIEKTWIGGATGTGSWTEPSYWDPAGVPNNNVGIPEYEVVIDGASHEGPSIPDGANIAINKLTINESNGFVEIQDGGVLEIENSGTDGLDSAGTINVDAGGTLTLNGGSIKSKTINLIGIEGTSKKAKLELKSDTTLNAPSGAAIVGSDPDDTSGAGCGICPGPDPEAPDGLILGDGELTLASGTKIHGELEIATGLVNNGVVDADEEEGKIFLSTTSKSGGSGADFKATAGLLDVDVDVTGSADWTVQETGFLLVQGGDIWGTDFSVLRVNSTNPWVYILNQDVTLAGNLDVTMTATFGNECPFDDPPEPPGSGNIQWNWINGSCKFTGGVDPAPYVTLEVAARDFTDLCSWDLGVSMQCMASGFEVVIGEGARVKLVDAHNNFNRNGENCPAECFRTQKLTFEDEDGRFDLNDIDAHFMTLTGDESQIEGNPQCEDGC